MQRGNTREPFRAKRVTHLLGTNCYLCLRVVHQENWSGRWDSNPRPQPWQGCALPLSYTRKPVFAPPRTVPAAKWAVYGPSRLRMQQGFLSCSTGCGQGVASRSLAGPRPGFTATRRLQATHVGRLAVDARADARPATIRLGVAGT